MTNSNNPEFNTLRGYLHHFKLSAPSPEADARIEKALLADGPRMKTLKSPMLALWLLTAAAVILVFLFPGRIKTPPSIIKDSGYSARKVENKEPVALVFDLREVPVTKRMFHVATDCGNKFALWGGKACSGGKRLVDGAVFDPAQNEWKALPAAQIPGRIYPSIAGTDDWAVVWGGAHEDEWEKQGVFLKDGVCYDLKNLKASTMEDAPIEGREHPKIFAEGNHFIVFGGVQNGWGYMETPRQTAGSPDAKPCMDGAFCDVETGKWTSFEECPLKARFDPQVELIGEKLFVFGGWSSFERFAPFGPGFAGEKPADHSVKDGAVYDVTKAKWTLLPETPKGIKGALKLHVLDKGKVLVWAVSALTGAIYDLEKNSWSPLPEVESLQQVEYSLSSFYEGGKFVVFTSQMRIGVCDLSKEIFSWDKNCPLKWRDGLKPQGHFRNGNFLFFGGKEWDKSKPLYKNDGAIFDLNSGAWREISASPFEMKERENYITVFNGRHLALMGGVKTTGMKGDEPSYFKDGCVFDLKENKWGKQEDFKLEGSGSGWIPGLGEAIEGSTGALVVNAQKAQSMFFQYGK